MIDYAAIRTAIASGLKNYLGCPVIRSSQNAEPPKYPYISYTITTPAAEHKGTYSQAADGTLYKSILQTWSFTALSDDQPEAVNLAFKMYDYFSTVGVTTLADSNITVRSVGSVSSRDNILTTEYEYRNGLDIRFGLLDKITPVEQIDTGKIESYEYTKEE